MRTAKGQRKSSNLWNQEAASGGDGWCNGWGRESKRYEEIRVWRQRRRRLSCVHRTRMSLIWLQQNRKTLLIREKPLSVLSNEKRSCCRLPTSTSCCFFSFGTVSKSTACSGFYNEKQRVWESKTKTKFKSCNSSNWKRNQRSLFLTSCYTYKLVDGRMQPSSVNSLHCGDGF